MGASGWRWGVRVDVNGEVKFLKLENIFFFFFWGGGGVGRGVR